MNTHQQALDKAKIALMSKADTTFFTTVCFSLKHVWDDSIPTAATEGTAIYFNPEFFMKLSPEERVFVLIHESMHCAYLHMDRLQDREHRKWNIAADHVINLQLLERGFKMPANGVADYQYQGLSTEEVYKLLPDPQEGEGEGGIGMDLKDPTESSEQLQSNIQDILVRASIQAKMAGDSPGSIPGDIQIFLDRLLKPKLPWNRILQKFLQTFAKNDYTFKRPNRRFFPKHHLPSLYSESLLNLAIAVDTSGSVSDTEFNRFVSETHSILRMMKPEKITLIQFDTAIKSVTGIRNVNELMKITFVGRGGTKITPVLDWVNENKPQVLLVFSDGEFRFYSTETKIQTIWLIHNNEHFKAPFGKIIHYETES